MKESIVNAPFVLFVIAVIFIFCIDFQDTHAEKKPGHDETPDLVIGIIVDQMRPDYIYRYWDKFGDDGFKRLVNDGFSFRNTQFRYMRTSTGPGQAAPLTGTTPSIHGLIGNGWYVRELDRNMNVIADLESGGPVVQDTAHHGFMTLWFL